MPRRRSATLQFNAIQLVGGLLPASLIEQIARQEAAGQKATDYGLQKNQRLQVAVDQAWSRARALWQEAQQLRQRGEDLPWAPWFTRRLLEQVFGWSDLEPCPPRQITEALFPINHQAFGGTVPVVLTSLPSEELDKGHRQFGQDNRRRSPHSCLQECLNADDGSNWGLLGNGASLRLLHDNPALVKPAYVQVDIGAIFEGGLFDEFAVVWLLLHASRFQPDTAADDGGRCILDGWKEAGQQSGERALNKLRDGVQAALEAMGQGVLQHPANGELVERLQSGELSTQDFFRQLLRLVYRLLFLCVAEDRGLLFPPQAPLELRQIYHQGYSLSRLRDLAIRSGAHEQQHSDLWKVQRLVFAQMQHESSPLGLPALGGLFNADRCPDLDQAEISNAALLEAVRAIGWFYDEQSQSRTRINYQALNTEEFGSVYESLLELHPQIRPQGGLLRFSLGGVAGSERKTSGSYYTPEDLVRLLILSALLPVIRDRLSQASTQEEKEAALLAIRVLDPACGSGHFLLAAARRLALELARIRAGDDEPSEDLRRHCLREVVAKCLHGVDKNPMAVELCKVALWIEAIEPGKPLGFLDAHIQCGDSLVGVFDAEVLKDGIPDGAYKPLTGDDKRICSLLKKKNQAFVVKGQGDLFTAGAMSQPLPAAAGYESIEEDDLAAVRRKEQAYQAWRNDPAIRQELQRADAYTAAFFLPKKEEAEELVPVSQNLDELERGSLLSLAMASAIAKAAKDFRFLHWHLAFPEVMKGGGFDCVLGNPPWERIKLQEKEFFAVRSESIAAAANKPSRERMIDQLRTENASTADQLLAQEFELTKRGLDASIEFAKSGLRFPLTGHGTLNTYALFSELCLGLIGPLGRLGIIVPTGIATDDSGSKFTAFIMSGHMLISLYDFENKNAIFPGVHRSYKFCLLTIGNGTSGASDLSFFGSSVSDLSDARRHFSLSGDQIRLVNPESETIPVLRSSFDAELTLRIYSRNPVLKSSHSSRDSNWGIVLRRMLHKTMDADKLIPSSGQELVDLLPVYEGSCGWQYDHRYATYEGDGYSLTSNEWKSVLSNEISTESYLDTSTFQDIIAAWIDNGLLQSSGLLGFRRVARSTDERTIVACIMPILPSTYGWILTLGVNDQDATYLLGLYNSVAFDYLARNSLSQPSIPQGCLSRLQSLPGEKASHCELK